MRFERALKVLPASSEELGSYSEYLAHDELELALGELEEIGGRRLQPPAFWEHLRWAAENMELHGRLDHLRHEEAGSRNGCYRIHLKVATVDEGGVRQSIVSGLRMPWDVGAVYEGRPTLTDGWLWVEYQARLDPGSSGDVRVVPLFPEYWNLDVGDEVGAHVGSRRIAQGKVTEVVLVWTGDDVPRE